MPPPAYSTGPRPCDLETTKRQIIRTSHRRHVSVTFGFGNQSIYAESFLLEFPFNEKSRDFSKLNKPRNAL